MARKKSDSSHRKGQAEETGTSPPPGTSTTNTPAEPAKAKPSKPSKKGRLLPDSTEDSYEVANDEHFARFRAQLGPYGLTMRDIPGDGNCLFRALGDQLEGNTLNHFKHRMDTVRYMIAHRPDFEPFLDDTNTFEGYVDALSRNGTYAGQDCIVAFARTRKVNVVVHQLNARPLFMQGGETGCPELHVSYHNGEHYSSVRRQGDLSHGPADVRLGPNGTPSDLSLIAPLPCPPTLPPSLSVPVSSASALWDSASATENDSALEDVSSNAGGAHGGAGGDGEVVDEDLDALLAFVMEQSQVADPNLARQCLVAHGLNAELTIDYLLNIQIIAAGSIPNPAASPPSSAPPSTAQQNKKLGGRKKSPLRRGLLSAGSGTVGESGESQTEANTPPSLHCLNL